MDESFTKPQYRSGKGWKSFSIKSILQNTQQKQWNNELIIEVLCPSCVRKTHKSPVLNTENYQPFLFIYKKPQNQIGGLDESKVSYK